MKLALLIFLVILATNLGIGIGVPFLNLALLLVTGLVIFDRLKYGLIAALVGGILLDLYSIFPPGIFIASLLVSLAISVKIKKKFSLEAAGNVFVLGIISAACYEISVLALAGTGWLLKLSQIEIIFSREWLVQNVWFILFNGLIVALVFLIVRRYRQKVYGTPSPNFARTFDSSILRLRRRSYSDTILRGSNRH